MGRLIDADALLKKLDDSIWYNVADFNEAWYAVDHAPTVEDVPVRHGRWIDKSGGIEGAWNYCSVCGEQAIDLYDYCPYCGARMDGEAHGTK